MSWLMSELVPSPTLMVEDMPLVVAPDARSRVVLVGHASLGRAEGDGRAYPIPAVCPCKVLEG